MNQHYEFWVNYYEGLKVSDVAFSRSIPENNRRLTGHRWTPSDIEIRPAEAHNICLQVSYPGLLVGLGNTHAKGGTEKNKDKDDQQEDSPEIKLGFTLDTVTGLPYLPGSTVKGILRSVFLANRSRSEKPDEEEKTSYVRFLLAEQGVELSEQQIEQLELDIFGHQHPHGVYEYEAKTDAGKGKDIFLDAWPVEPDKEKHLLGLENITPHRADDYELDGLTEPNPLTLLKVMPGVVFLFRFQLSDSCLGEDGPTVTADQKLALFRSLLLDLGAGAKTNVGFGMLTKPTGWNMPSQFCYLELLTKQKEEKLEAEQAEKTRLRDAFPVHSACQAIVEDSDKNGWILNLIHPVSGRLSGVKARLHKNKVKKITPQTGDTLQVVISTNDLSKDLLNVSLKK